jgi:pSer/pThr/pTyr-binding forkhead associated (FHA) protein/anti-anti-sigma regulatory factor
MHGSVVDFVASAEGARMGVDVYNPGGSDSDLSADDVVSPRFTLRLHRGIALVTLEDRHLINEGDIQDLSQALDHLIAAGLVRMAIGFGKVQSMSSRVVAVVMKVHRKCVAAGGQLKVHGVGPGVAGAFAITRLDTQIEFFATERDALASYWTMPAAKGASTGQVARVATPKPGPRPAESSAPSEATRGGVDAVRLIVVTGRAMDQEVPIRCSPFLIGRDLSCHLRAHSPLVSRLHAEIELRGDMALIRDRRSSNGTRLNDRILHGEEAALSDGDEVQIGPLCFRLAITKPAAGGDSDTVTFHPPEAVTPHPGSDVAPPPAVASARSVVMPSPDLDATEERPNLLEELARMSPGEAAASLRGLDPNLMTSGFYVSPDALKGSDSDPETHLDAVEEKGAGEGEPSKGSGIESAVRNAFRFFKPKRD